VVFHISCVLLLKVVLGGAFYPNYFTWKISDEELAMRQMSGFDPTTTVMVSYHHYVCSLLYPGCVKVSGLPQHPYQYRALLCQIFGAYGKGKALHFEGSR